MNGVPGFTQGTNLDYQGKKNSSKSQKTSTAPNVLLHNKLKTCGSYILGPLREVIRLQIKNMYVIMSLVLFSKPVVSCIEEKAMSLSVFKYCICTFLCGCCNFNLSLCHLSPFLLSYVTVSKSCRLSEFDPTLVQTVVYFYWQIANVGQSHIESTVKANAITCKTT